MNRDAGSSNRHGFTLVEVLVAVAIIVLLIGLITLAASKVRRLSDRTLCTSNVRQISLALLGYVKDYDYFPGPAASARAEDWIYWQNNRDLRQSRLAPYLNGMDNQEVLQCPAEEFPRYRSRGQYAFSYTVNEKMTGYYQPAITLGSIQNPTTKIMVVCESAETLDDGCWCPTNFIRDGHNVLSIRHDQIDERSRDLGAGRGVCSFADGHAEYTDRIHAQTPEYYDPKLP